MIEAAGLFRFQLNVGIPSFSVPGATLRGAELCVSIPNTVTEFLSGRGSSGNLFLQT
jgi:hypothetical protein